MEVKPYIRKAHFYETDQMAIIHHANYIRWFEEARVDFMEQMGYGYDKCSVEAGIDIAVLGVSCEYKSMLHFNDVVEIRVFIKALAPMRMTVGYEITNSKTGKITTTGESQHCYYDNRRQRPVSLKRALPDLYALFESLNG